MAPKRTKGCGSYLGSRRGMTCLWALISFACVASVPTCSAEAGRTGDTERSNGGVLAYISTKGTNGYRIAISISGHRAALSVAKQHSVSVYRSSDTHLNRSRFSAEFGGYGHIALTFTPMPRRKSQLTMPRRRCVRYRDVTFGSFVGQAHFVGERHYTSLSAKRLYGLVGYVYKDRTHACKRPHMDATTEPSRPATSYRLKGFSLGGRPMTRFSGGRGAFAEVRKWEESTGVSLRVPEVKSRDGGFSALAFEFRRKVQIDRVVVARASRRSIDVDPDGNVTVLPEGPFVGRGFQRICRPTSWRGDLKVKFPGKVIQLTGEKFWVIVQPTPTSCPNT